MTKILFKYSTVFEAISFFKMQFTLTGHNVIKKNPMNL